MTGKRNLKLFAWSIVIGLMVVMLNPSVNSSIISNEVSGTPAGWTNDTRLTNSISPDANPSISAYQNNVHIVWRDIWLGNGRVFYKNSTDGGQIWGNQKQLNIGGNGDYPDIATNTTNLHVVYNDNIGVSNKEIAYCNSTDGGTSWCSPKYISADDGLKSEGPKIAVNNSNIHVVWTDSRLAQTEVYYKRSIDDGITWDDALGANLDRRITHDLSGAGPVGIEVNNSNIHVLFMDDRDGSADVYYIRSIDNGVTWDNGSGTIDEERKLTSNATVRIGAAISVNGSTIHVIWVDEVLPGPNYYLYYRNSTDNGYSWNPIQLLAGGVNDPNKPDMTVDGNNIHIVWDAAYDDKDIYYINSTNGGGSWSAPLRISINDTFNSYWPQIEVSGDIRHIIWYDSRDGNQEIYYKRYPEILPDIKSPDINHVPVASANISETINITANVTDDVGVDAVYLNYTGVNSTNYNVSMSQWDGNWSYNILGQDNIGTVDYFIWCNDTSGNANMTCVFQVQIVAAGMPTGWTDDIRLTNNVITDSSANIVAEGLDVQLSWTRNIGNYEIYHMKSRNGGNTWNTPSQISNSGVSARNSDIAMAGNNVSVVWEDWKTPAWEIFYRNSTDGGDTWDSEKRISANDGFNSQGPKIAISPDSQNIHIIWVDSRHGAESVPANTEIYYNWSLDGGITWGTEKRLTNALYSSAPRGIEVNGSNIHVVFSDDRTGTPGLYYIRSRDNGVTWDDGQNNFGDARLISTNAVLQGAMAINGSNIHTVWVNEQAGPTCRIYYRNSTDNGGNWSTPTLLTGPNLGSYAPDVGVWADNVWVTWNDKRDDGSTPELYYKNSTSGGINWGTDTLLTEADGNSSGAPKIAIIDASIHITWEDQRDGNKEIYYKRFPEVLPDTEPPSIDHIPVASANIGQAINITANITDDVSVDAVYLNYTGTYATIYNVSMTQWNGNWSYDIPGQDTTGCVDYFIWCNDTSGNSNKTGVYQIQICEPIQTNLAIHPGWNLVSFPVLLPKINGSAIACADDLATATGCTMASKWDASGQAYINYIAGFNLPTDPENFAIGEDDGIFVWWDESYTNVFNVTGYEPGPRSVRLLPGWNVVGYMGNASADVTLWAGQVSCSIYDDICYWDGVTFRHYIFPGTEMYLVPTRGYFIWSDSETWLNY
ncbi:MAG: sialidase family protein [Thermoplasmata archaeon]|nr:sialidase family protein [Thermoplasmata archaeon]